MEEGLRCDGRDLFSAAVGVKGDPGASMLEDTSLTERTFLRRKVQSSALDMHMQKRDLGTLRGRCSDVIHTEMTRLEQTCEPLMMG